MTTPFTADSIDPIYNQPFVDCDEVRQDPIPHRYVSGGFRGTEARFSFYFPPRERYRGRFFHNTYPMATSSDIGPFPIAFEVATGDLGFTIDSGAYYVQTNNGGLFRAVGVDPAIAAYRVNAAAATFSRRVAADVYDDDKRPWGYLFGGSGGAYQTIGAAESVSGVWDGFLPFVPGCDHAIPSMFTVRMHALRELRRRDRLPGIADALDVGGGGDPYAALNPAEAAALREVSLMGFPPRGWYGHAAMDSGYFSNISGMIPLMDPTYVDDFWSKPGYLGGDPAAPIHADRRRLDTAIAAITAGPAPVVVVETAPDGDFANAHLVLTSGAAAGASLPIASAAGTELRLIAHIDPSVIAAIQPGDTARIDNSWALALETYHRHQLPPSDAYWGWNQFRDAAGAPIYPQRPVLVGPTGTANAAGATLSGRFHGKMLMLSCLLDIDAFAWQAAWYGDLAKQTLGDEADDRFALYFVDRAHHENPMTPLARTHAVSYGGALQQGLRDLAAWVEDGVPPRASRYEVVETQVVLPATAAERQGIQPTVTLQANGHARAEAAVGEPVTFTADIAVPPGAGRIVAAEWDFGGEGAFAEASRFEPQERLTLTASHSYAQPGVHFAALRVTAQRDGDPATPYTRIQNLARARIVVR